MQCKINKTKRCYIPSRHGEVPRNRIHKANESLYIDKTIDSTAASTSNHGLRKPYSRQHRILFLASVHIDISVCLQTTHGFRYKRDQREGRHSRRPLCCARSTRGGINNKNIKNIFKIIYDVHV